MNTKMIKGIALIFLIAIIVLNVTVVFTKNTSGDISIKNLESKAECVSGEGISGYIGLMKNALCFYGDLATGHFVNGCTDADATCTI